MLLGGAGGYLPDTRTPEVWVVVASGLVGFPLIKINELHK